jgi:hypothetical protein
MSKKFLISFGLLAVFTIGCVETIIYAQSFPTTVHGEFSPNAASDNVTSYIVDVDGLNSQILGIAVNPTCNCIRTNPFTINDNKPHVMNARAVNDFGPSLPASLTFTVKVPTTMTGVVKGGN